MSNTRSLFGDLAQGFKGRCLACNEGRLFGKYLKVVDRCEKCGEEFFHHRADDFPPYIVVAILGHVLLSLTLWMETTFAPSYLFYIVTILPLTLLMTFLLLPRVKGAVVAVQWRIGMDGFGPAKEARTRAS